MQVIALVQSGVDVALLVADAAARPGAGAGLNLALSLGRERRRRDGERRDERQKSGNELLDGNRQNTASTRGLGSMERRGVVSYADHIDCSDG